MGGPAENAGPPSDFKTNLKNDSIDEKNKNQKNDSIDAKNKHQKNQKINSVDVDRSSLPEIVLEGRLAHRSIAEEFWTTFTVDTGSGHSYLIGECSDVFTMITQELDNPLQVHFADGNTQDINKYMEIEVILVDHDGADVAKTHTRIYLLHGKPAGGSQILLGRDLIKKLDLTIHGTKAVKVGNRTLFATTDDHISYVDTDVFTEIKNDEFIENNDDLIKDEERLRIAYVAETSAPFGRPTLTIPWKTEQRPKLSYGVAKARDKQTCARLTKSEAELYAKAIDILLEGRFANLITCQRDTT